MQTWRSKSSELQEHCEEVIKRDFAERMVIVSAAEHKYIEGGCNFGLRYDGRGNCLCCSVKAMLRVL